MLEILVISFSLIELIGMSNLLETVLRLPSAVFARFIANRPDRQGKLLEAFGIIKRESNMPGNHPRCTQCNLRRQKLLKDEASQQNTYTMTLLLAQERQKTQELYSANKRFRQQAQQPVTCNLQAATCNLKPET